MAIAWEFGHPTIFLYPVKTSPDTAHCPPAAAWLAAQAALKLREGQVRPDRQLWCQLPGIKDIQKDIQ